jgi:hypothetical protein
MSFAHISRRWAGPALVGLIAVEALLLVSSPAEQTLGQVVKLVYLHGALIRAGLLSFVVAGLLGLVYLAVRRPGVYAWLVAVQRGAFAVWIVYALSSMLVTYMTWGVAIAWSEPRVMATIRVTVAVLVVFAVTEILRLPALTALGNVLLAGFTLWATQSASVIRHPIDPIGASSSAAIRGFYAAIVVVMLTIVALIVVLLRARPAASPKES